MNNSGLRQQAVSGAKWVGTANIATTLLLFIRLTILGRILDPSDFGLMSMIMVVINFAFVFSDIGISKAIIQRQDINKEQLSTLYWINIIMGIMIMLAIMATAPWVAAFYREERLILLTMICSLTFPITAIGQQFQVLLEKSMKFDTLAFADIMSSLVGTVTTIVCALLGLEVFSLVVGQLTIATVKMLFTLIPGLKMHKPILYFNKAEIKGFIGFGLFQMGERCVDYLSGNISSILIGRFLGPEILGVYYFAYQIVLMPLSRINPILTRVAFPIFSVKQSDNNALSRGYIELSKLIATIVIPILAGIAVTAQLAIPLVFGSKWLDSIILIQIMAIRGVFLALCNPIGTIQLAKGRADIGFYWNIIIFLLGTLLMLLTIGYGVIVLTVTQVALSIFSFVASLFIIRYMIGMGIPEYSSAVSKPGKYSLIMGTLVYLAYLAISALNINQYILLGVLVLFGVMIYLALEFTFDRTYCMDLWKSLLYRRRAV